MVTIGRQPAAGPGATGRHPALDIVRAASILWVVGVWHILDYLPDMPGTRNAVTYRITVAMLGSFVLVSGYLMGRKDIGAYRREAGDFYRQRLARIYPPFAGACALFLVMRLADPAALAKAVLLVAMLWGPPPVTLWFIAMIVLFYAVTPWLAGLRSRAPVYAAVVLAMTALLAGAPAATGTVSPRLAMYFPAYAAGLWLGRAPPRWRVVGLAGLILAIPALAMTTVPAVAAIENSPWSAAWALAAPLLLVGGAMAADGALPRIAAAGLIAEASYFLYLFHRAVYAIVLKVANPAAPLSRAALLVGIGLPVALAIALAGQRRYDRLWRRLAAGRRSPEGAPPPR